MPTANEKLDLAYRHLEKVLDAWDAPTDWDDLAVYGFYCLENAVDAAGMHLGLPTPKNHFMRAQLASELHTQHDLPDVEPLLRDLNEARKAAAYGDVEAPDLDAETIATQIEVYLDAVSRLLEEEDDDVE